MKTPNLFNVIVTANLAYQPNSAMLSGIMSYVKTHTSWNITLLTGRLEEPTRFNADEVDGVVIDFIKI